MAIFLTILTVVFVTIFFIYFIDNQNNNIQIENVDIKLPKPIGKTFIFLSDYHLGLLKNQSYVQKIVHLIQDIHSRENIDYVLHGGDFSETLKIEHMNQVLSPFSQLTQKQYAILGNHDYAYFDSPLKYYYYSKPNTYSLALISALEKAGIEMIENKVVLEKDFNLVGISSRCTTFQNVNTALELPNNTLPTITLIHEPYTALLTPESSSDLYLAGHTHAGQIRIPFLPWLSRKVVPKDNIYKKEDKFFAGLYNLGPRGQMFIGSGLGESTIPLRLNNKPKIFVLKL
jgi:uncharacterized protein